MSTTSDKGVITIGAGGHYRNYAGRGEIVSPRDGWTPTGKMSDTKRARIVAAHDASIPTARVRHAYCRDCGAEMRAWEGHGQSGEHGMCHDCA